jgi:2-oxoglutarate dehydrogenase E1 component
MTTPAQYFHALRRQLKVSFRKPLVIMTPKSLLRHAQAISPVTDLIGGSFQAVLDDGCDPHGVERVLLCSGKVYYELLEQRQALDRADTALVRVEQLYPFPERAIGASLERYPNKREVVWVQEERRNGGAWPYVQERFRACLPEIALRYHGREESASSATGAFRQFQTEQKALVEGAFAPASD